MRGTYVTCARHLARYQRVWLLTLIGRRRAAAEMPPLVRYFPAEYAHAFIERGEVLLRSLSYFRDYEDDGVRSDENEGTLVHHPREELRVTLVASGEQLQLPHRFEATAREGDIFIYCMSTELSRDIAMRFRSDTAVEIVESTKFLARVRSAISLRRRLCGFQLAHGHVRYYEWHEPPGPDWALPDVIAMRKLKTFDWQKEYRFVVPAHGAFDVENVKLTLVPAGYRRPKGVQPYPEIRLKLGNLSQWCRLHTLAR